MLNGATKLLGCAEKSHVQRTHAIQIVAIDIVLHSSTVVSATEAVGAARPTRPAVHIPLLPGSLSTGHTARLTMKIAMSSFLAVVEST